MNRIALYHLETLLAIARMGTFAAAAERLNTSQPTISARMHELEHQLGFPIFRREGRRMALTVRGRQLAQDCELLWSNIESTLLRPNGFTGATGVVRIGSGEIAAASFLPTFVGEIEEALPRVTLQIELDLTARMLQNLLNGTSDMVFLAGPIQSPGLRTVSVGSVGLRWLANPDTAKKIKGRAPGEWSAPIWSLPSHSPLYGIAIDALNEIGHASGPINTCNNVRSLIAFILQGNGIALVPETMIGDEITKGLLIDVLARPRQGVCFEAAVRARESDPVVLELFRRAKLQSINHPRSEGSGSRQHGRWMTLDGMRGSSAVPVKLW